MMKLVRIWTPAKAMSGKVIDAHGGIKHGHIASEGAARSLCGREVAVVEAMAPDANRNIVCHVCLRAARKAGLSS